MVGTSVEITRKSTVLKSKVHLATSVFGLSLFKYLLQHRREEKEKKDETARGA